MKEVRGVSYRSNATFQEALEIIEKFPESQREDLINIVRKRIIEQRRERLAKSVEESRVEYSKGAIKKGTVSDLMKDIAK